jgi:hypothetical protein
MRSKEKLQPLAISRAAFSCSPSTLRREYPRKTEFREGVPSWADPEWQSRARILGIWTYAFPAPVPVIPACISNCQSHRT